MKEKIINISIKKARSLCNHTYDKFLTFAFIYDKSKLLAYGKNRMNKTDAFVKYIGNKYNIDKFKDLYYTHAEVNAISKLWGRTKITSKHSIVVVRFLKNGKIACAKPCESCQLLLDSLGLNRIYWTEHV